MGTSFYIGLFLLFIMQLLCSSYIVDSILEWNKGVCPRCGGKYYFHGFTATTRTWKCGGCGFEALIYNSWPMDSKRLNEIEKECC